MQPRSSWSRGLLYAVISGVLVLLAVAAVAIVNGESIGSTLQAGGVGVILWGGVGFLLGFFGHAEASQASVGDLGPQTWFSVVRRWIYRVIAGLALGHIAGAVVEGLMLLFIVCYYGG